jgi:hypothetical protein
MANEIATRIIETLSEGDGTSPCFLAIECMGKYNGPPQRAIKMTTQTVKGIAQIVVQSLHATTPSQSGYFEPIVFNWKDMDGVEGLVTGLFQESSSVSIQLRTAGGNQTIISSWEIDNRATSMGSAGSRSIETLYSRLADISRILRIALTTLHGLKKKAVATTTSA